jgi:hypothetical protein
LTVLVTVALALMFLLGLSPKAGLAEDGADGDRSTSGQ